MPEKPSKGDIWWIDGRNKKQERDISYILNVLDYRESPCFSLLLLAANRHLSVGEMVHLLRAHELRGSRSWVERRRWYVRNPKEDYPRGPNPNPDGRDDDAFAIMADNPEMSSKRLSWELRHCGLKRKLQWVRQWRYWTPALPNVESPDEQSMT